MKGFIDVTFHGGVERALVHYSQIVFTSRGSTYIPHLNGRVLSETYEEIKELIEQSYHDGDIVDEDDIDRFPSPWY